MPEALTQVGVGGIFAIFVIREVLAFLKERNGKGGRHAGEQATEYWQVELRKATADVVAISVVPILSNQTNILNDLKTAQQDSALQMARVVALIEALARR